MRITIEVGQPLTNAERQILRVILGEDAPRAEEPKAEPVKAEPVKAEPPSDDIIEQAKARGIALLKEGKADTVRRGVEAAGASRVTEMTEDQARQFLDEVGQ